jgi:glycosyltransferase involved in cell wall biosynthesis
VVYGNTLQSFWAISAGHAAGIPTVWNPRESEPWVSYFDYLAPELRRHAYAGFAQAYAVVFVANSTRNSWAPVDLTNNARVIHNGISVERMTQRMGRWTREAARSSLELDDDTIAVVLLGTVCDRKGQIDLVRAAARLSADVARRCRLLIVGDRPSDYSNALHAEVERLPAAARRSVSVVPENGDPYRYFRAADISVCTSRIESYPRIILESMACGLPIVTTSVFGIAEQVREGVNALFYEQAQPADLANKLSRLVLDGEERRRMAEASPHVLGGLTSYDEMLESYAEVFREAAAYAVPRAK